MSTHAAIAPKYVLVKLFLPTVLGLALKDEVVSIGGCGSAWLQALHG